MAQKKFAALPPLTDTLAQPAADDREATVLELDELWSFVLKKANKRWIWIALSRRTRQVVAYCIGDRSEATCQKLWERIPAAYRSGVCFTDFWEAYASVIPAEQHTACGKESGLTAHVERWNNTLRQRLVVHHTKDDAFKVQPLGCCGETRQLKRELCTSKSL